MSDDDYNRYVHEVENVRINQPVKLNTKDWSVITLRDTNKFLREENTKLKKEKAKLHKELLEARAVIYNYMEQEEEH